METKVCTKCKKELTFNNFDKSKSGKNGLKAYCKECRKQYRQDNKESIAEYSKQYIQDNKESLAERNKQYCQNNKESIAEYGKQYRQEHLEQSKQYTRNNKEKRKQYAQEHLEEGRVRWQTRNARKRLLLSTLTIQQWESIKERFNNKCAYCGKELPLAQEHVIPLSKGGEYTHNNIIPVCQKCNSSKGVKDFSVWYPQYENYSKKREKAIFEFLNYKNGIQQLALV